MIDLHVTLQFVDIGRRLGFRTSRDAAYGYAVGVGIWTQTGVILKLSQIIVGSV